MNENEVTLTFVVETHEDEENGCEGCDMLRSDCLKLRNGIGCSACDRTDGRNVIFKLKEQK